jgi:hypothetical protein
MPAPRKLMLPFAHWPYDDQRRWQAAFQCGDLFDENGPGTRLASATRQLRLESHARFLGFLSAKHPKLLKRPPEARIDRRILAEYVAWRRRSCGDTSLAADLCSLGGTLKLIRTPIGPGCCLSPIKLLRPRRRRREDIIW